MYGSSRNRWFTCISSRLKIVDSLASFTYTADAIRRHGAIPSVELSHSGQYSGTYLVDKDKKRGLSQWG